MSMTAAEIRLKQNPILTNLLLGLGQGTYVAELLFPRLPQALSSVTLARLGNERLRRYNLRRAPGTATKRLISRVPSVGEEKVTMSPRCGSAVRATIT